METKILRSSTGKKFFVGCILMMACAFSNATTHTVQVGDYYFSPSSIAAAVGDTIVWTWASGGHTTTSTTIPDSAATWNAPMTSTSTTFQYVITRTGVYNYRCNVHPTMMLGTITVGNTSAITETSDDKGITIYPNPSPGLFEVIAPKPIQVVKVYDEAGHEIYTTQINAVNATVDLTGQPNGIYFMRLLFEDKSEVVVKKIIIGN